MRDALVERDEALVDAHKPCCGLDEVDVYVWPKAADGKSVKEAPIKESDHGMDAMRYLVAYVDKIDRASVHGAGISGEGKADGDTPGARRPETAGLRDVGW
jgi:phage terminase large subunit